MNRHNAVALAVGTFECLVCLQIPFFFDFLCTSKFCVSQTLFEVNHRSADAQARQGRDSVQVESFFFLDFTFLKVIHTNRFLLGGLLVFTFC